MNPAVCKAMRRLLCNSSASAASAASASAGSRTLLRSPLSPSSLLSSSVLSSSASSPCSAVVLRAASFSVLSRNAGHTKQSLSRMQRFAAKKKPAPAAAKAVPKKESPYVFTAEWAKLYKDAPDVELKPDAEYPDWLWELDGKSPSLVQLQKDAAADFDGMSKPHRKRLFKLLRKETVKGDNTSRG